MNHKTNQNTLYKIPANTLFTGKNLIFVPECHSTNNLAQQLWQQSTQPPEGTVIITDSQTAGRGQQGNTWTSDPGANFTFSVILKPAFLLAKDQFYLSMAISLGVYDYLKSLVDVPVAIKWPNDILIGEKKVCGMLLENSLQGASLTGCIAGIGLNMNQKTFAHDRASSVSLFAGHSLKLTDELEPLLSCLERRYLQLREGKTNVLGEHYQKNLFGVDEAREYVVSGKKLQGTIRGVDAVGRLKVSTPAGERAFALKEIEFVY